jgi:hypothetical protein
MDNPSITQCVTTQTYPTTEAVTISGTVIDSQKLCYIKHIPFSWN